MRVGPFAFRYQGNGATPCQYTDTTHSKGNWLRYNFAADSFYIMLIFPLDKLNIHQVWSWYDHPLPSYSVIAADTLRDLVTLTFDLLSVVIHGGSRGNPSTKFEDATAIRSWVMSFDICHRIPLTMRLESLRMRRITWPMSRGKFFPHIWNPWPQFSNTTFMALRWWQEYRWNRAPKIAFFWEKGVNVTFWFSTPKRHTLCAKLRVLTYFVWMYVVAHFDPLKLSDR